MYSMNSREVDAVVSPSLIGVLALVRAVLLNPEHVLSEVVEVIDLGPECILHQDIPVEQFVI
jgi:hypothetical protein